MGKRADLIKTFKTDYKTGIVVATMAISRSKETPRKAHVEYNFFFGNGEGNELEQFFETGSNKALADKLHKFCEENNYLLYSY